MMLRERRRERWRAARPAIAWTLGRSSLRWSSRSPRRPASRRHSGRVSAAANARTRPTPGSRGSCSRSWACRCCGCWACSCSRFGRLPGPAAEARRGAAELLDGPLDHGDAARQPARPRPDQPLARRRVRIARSRAGAARLAAACRSRCSTSGPVPPTSRSTCFARGAPGRRSGDGARHPARGPRRGEGPAPRARADAGPDLALVSDGRRLPFDGRALRHRPLARAPPPRSATTRRVPARAGAGRPARRRRQRPVAGRAPLARRAGPLARC